ncbi:hypothetical protein I5699_25315 [Burkholderia cenocepacia]|nr:hypothetical protein [Burkholderia cenocepacia]
MGSSQQGIAFRSVYNNKWISLVTGYSNDVKYQRYEACKDTPDAFCMFFMNPAMGMFIDVEGNWIMQGLDDSTQLIPFRSAQPVGTNIVDRARFSFTKNALGQGDQVSIVTLDGHLAWAVDDNGTNQGVLSLATPYTLDYVGDEINGKLTFEFWDSAASPWPPA